MTGAGVFDAVLFDLDGTLLDTAPDMGGALNRLLRERGRAPLDDAQIRPQVSHGSRGLIGAGFALTPQDDEFGALRDRFLSLYRERLAVDTVPFAGIAETLRDLARRELRWGIVTNKPGHLTDPLLAALRLDPAPGCTVSGDTVGVAKPDPAPLLHAAALLGVEPRRCVYVGDAERDVQAARRAGMRALIAGYGYIGDDDRPQDWGADHTLARPDDLLRWLDAAG